jgi:zinc/manganese transport system permease protein
MGNPTLSWNLVSDFDQLTKFQFMINALEAATIVAVLAGVVGWFMVLRRQSFSGHTLATMAFPGAAGGALIGLPGTLGYYLACGVSALVLARTGAGAGTRARAAESAAIGTTQAVGFGLGFLFLSLYSGVLVDLETLLFGTYLGITRSQVLTLLLVAAAVLALLVAIGRPLLFATLDPQVARARGVRVAVLDLVFLLILAAAVAVTSQITGALLVFALLVMPAATAQLITSRPLPSLALTVAFGLLVSWLGLGISYFSPYPVGFFTTTFAFALFVLVHVGRLVAVRAGRRAGPSASLLAPTG